MSTLQINTLKSLAPSTSPPAFQRGDGMEVGRLCRAFVNFNGTGAVAIRAAFNVSSITDNGVGDYTVNFTNVMADVDYSVVGSSRGTAANSITMPVDDVSARTVTGFRLQTVNSAFAVTDVAWVNYAIFR